MKYYGIMYKGKPLGISVVINLDIYSIEYILEKDYDECDSKVWLVDDLELAQNVIDNKKRGIYTSYNEPRNFIDLGNSDSYIFSIDIPIKEERVV